MKLKNALTVAALTVSTLFALPAAIAEENWVLITESKETGGRLVVDSESFSLVKDKEDSNSPYYIAAKFKMDGVNYRKPFALVTTANSCIKMQGDMWLRVFKNNEWTTIEEFFWSKNGGRIYDNGGEALCAILKVRTKEAEEKNSKKTPKISL